MVIILAVFSATPALPQSQPLASVQPKHATKSEADDRLGMTCAKMLQMTSSDWVAKFTSTNGSTPDTQVRAIRAYGRCYDERTDRLAASLAKNGKGPLMGARGNFRDFEAALQDFTAKALADTQPANDALKAAYASLYEKQFRYDFCRRYERRETNPPSGSKVEGAPADAQVSQDDPDEMTHAKNRFGELLDALPEDKMHDLHAAFGKVLGSQSAATAALLDLYRYAIYVLEPLSPPYSFPGMKPQTKPFSPPPF